MVPNCAVDSARAAQGFGRPPPRGRPRCVDRRDLRAENWNSLGGLAAGDGLRLRHDLLAAASGVARSGGLEKAARTVAGRTACCRPTRLVACDCGFRLDPRHGREKKTGPNPTDRAKPGSKHHVLTEAHGIPLVVHLTGANAHDVTELLPLVDDIPPVAGKVGHPKSKPDLVQADRGYDSQPHREKLHARRIETLIARRGEPHGSGLGKTRWVVERTISWLHQFRRLRIRFEKRDDIHEAFLSFASE